MTNVAVGEEIAYLRGRGWTAQRIADRLQIPVEIVMARHPDHRDDTMHAAGQAARREAHLVYTRSCPEYGSTAWLARRI